MTARADLARAQEDLKRLGYRMTPQRETILQVFEGLPDGTHLSAEDLHDRLRRHDGHQWARARGRRGPAGGGAAA